MLSNHFSAGWSKFPRGARQGASPSLWASWSNRKGRFCSVGECCEISRMRTGSPSGGGGGISRPDGALDAVRAAERNSIRRPCGDDGLRPRCRWASAARASDRWHRRSRWIRGELSRAGLSSAVWMPPQPLDRTPIREPLGCGIRAIDGFSHAGAGSAWEFSAAAAWAKAR